MWEQSEGQSLLRIQLLQAMQKMVTALNQQSPAAYPLLMPLLRHSTDINQPDELNLLEDGLQVREGDCGREVRGGCVECGLQPAR